MSRDCAELYESDEVAVENATAMAIEMYEQAADLFQMEDSKGQSSNCKSKVAELSSAALDPPDLLKAGQIYDELGRNCLDSNLLKFNAKGYFLQSILCQLANSDAIGAEQALQRYEGIDYTFSESREGKFARTLVECVDGMDAEGFAQACFEFDRVSKLDPWKTSMLVKVKRGIQGDDVTYLNFLAEKFRKAHGGKSPPPAVRGEGSFATWAYFHYGRWSLSTRGWWIPQVKPAAKKTQSREQGNRRTVAADPPARDPTLRASGLAQRTFASQSAPPDGR